jgi:hypothetical protein
MRPNHDREKPAHPEAPRTGPVGAEPEDRRADPRHPVDQPAKLKVLTPLQTPIRLSVHIIEMSRGGMKISVKQPLMPGALVQIRFQGKLALAEVRYCAPAGAEYHVGVRFQDVLNTDHPEIA